MFYVSESGLNAIIKAGIYQYICHYGDGVFILSVLLLINNIFKITVMIND